MTAHVLVRPLPAPIRADTGEKRRKRIVHMSSVHKPFDVRVFFRECKSSVARGFEVHIVVPHDRDEIVDGIHIWSVPVAKTRSRRMFATARAVYRRALALRADLYHFHDPELLPWGVLLQRRLGVPVIYDSHEFLALSMRHKSWLPDLAHRPLELVMDLLETFCVRRLAGVVAVTDEMGRGFRKIHDNVEVVANYPPLAFLERAQAVEPQPYSAVFTGPIDVSRGFVNIFEAMQIVRRTRPDAVCRIVGKLFRHRLPEPLASYSDEDFARHGIELLPAVPHERVPPLARANAVGWIASRRRAAYANAIPVKMIEFMALGIPVVMSDLTTAGEIVRTTGCGLTADAEDPASHAAALLRLWDNSDEARRMAENGRRAVREKYNWESQIDALVAVYERAWRERERKQRIA